MNNKNNKDEGKKELVPLNDHAFKKMFGEVGCEPQLITLINGLTGRTGEKAVKKITIVERTIPREQYDDKEIRLDILAVSDKGEQFNIEAQLRNVDMNPRTMFYSLRLLNKSVKKGQDYTEMNKVVTITIFGSRSKERDKHKEYYKHEEINEYIERYEFIMSKFNYLKDKDINNTQHRCLMFLSHRTDKKMRKKVIKMEPGLAKAQKIMDYINSNPEEIELYEMRELTKMDIKNAKERDKQEGKKEEKIEIATKMKNKGFSDKDIAEITSLSPDFIKKI